LGSIARDDNAAEDATVIRGGTEELVICRHPQRGHFPISNTNTVQLSKKQE